ncbi:MAG: M28 family peptidase, partial [bacterium]
MKVKVISVIGILLLLVFSAFSYLDVPSKTALYSIRPEDVRRHIDFLASDSLKGRNTPSTGLNIAAEYIEQEFERYGIQPLNDSYLQAFNLNKVHLAEGNSVKLMAANQTEYSLKIKREFMPYEFTANKEIKGELVFAGYGITASEYDYDDYQNLDVQGKVVLVLKHEPGEKDTASVFEGVKNTDHSKIRTKVENAIEHGATGLMVINDPLNHRSLRPRGFPWPSLYKNIPNEAVPYTLALSEGKKIPVVQVGKSFIRKVFGSVDSLKAIQKRMDAGLKPESFAIPNFTVTLKTSTSVDSTPTQNVVGIWEGSDPALKKQAIVIGAHYDHVGYKQDGVKPGEDYIYNGADDNASGT